MLLLFCLVVQLALGHRPRWKAHEEPHEPTREHHVHAPP
jgi:hypothetical protein